MNANFAFNDLFILDLANNHQGDLEHGLDIVAGVGAVIRKQGVRGAFKFQFRALETFIHPDYKAQKGVKHISRFMETALGRDDYATLVAAVRQAGMIPICTPFDEASVELIADLGIDIIKVASCSADDMPLLECVAASRKPVVVSTGGLNLEKIDRLVSLLEYKGAQFALMHCVALYPTPNDKLNLNQIETLRSRYPHVPVGFSTHEFPDNLMAVQLAYAKGARLFERHVGRNTERYKLNAYSSSPEQLDAWIDSWHQARTACGGEHRPPATPDELASLRSLARGVFSTGAIAKGRSITRDDVFFAMPLHEGQLKSAEWHDGMVADRDYAPLEPLTETLADPTPSENQLLYHILLQVKGILNNARIHISRDHSFEISHHYGLLRFREFGAVIINCINRVYCKKLIVQLPRQKHPYHYHKVKEETFQLLHGDLEIFLDGNSHQLKPGDIFLVEPNKWHKFHTLHGAVFEEVSTTHYDNDSYYEDETIARLPREKRKTVIPSWDAMLDTRR